MKEKSEMADKENKDIEGFDAEIEEAAASLDADSSLSLTNDTKIKPSPSNNTPDSIEKNDSAEATVQAQDESDISQDEPDISQDEPDILKTLAENHKNENKTFDFSDNSVDVSDKLEVLIPNVLDSAEATNAAADVAAKAASALETSVDRLQERVDVLTEASTRSTVLSTRILIGSVTALILSAFIYAFMAFQLASRTSQIDGMLIAVGKRIVKMNSALATFEDIKLSIENLSKKQNEFEVAQSSVLEAVEKSKKAALKLEKSVPEKAAERVGLNTEKVAVQVNKLQQKVEGHSSEAAKFNETVNELSKRMGVFENRLSDVRKLNKDVAALVKLERERYLEALKRQSDIEEAQLRSQLENTKQVDPSIIKYPKTAVRSEES